MGCGSETAGAPAGGQHATLGDARDAVVCTTDADCPAGERCVDVREGEFERRVCRAGEATVPAPPAAPPPPAPGPALADEPPVTVACPAQDPSVPSLGGGSAWVGQTAPASSDATDDGKGTAARIGYAIGLRFAPATRTLWINDGRIRTVDESGNVTSRYTGPMAGGYANVGVDADGNGYVATDTTHVRKLPAAGGAGVDIPMALPSGCSLNSLNVGADGHIYALCRSSPDPGPGCRFIDVTDASRVVLELPIVSVGTDFVVSADRKLWIADPNYQQVRRYDLETGEERDLFTGTCMVFAMALDEAGNFYAGPAKFAPSGRALGRFDRSFSYGLAATVSEVFAPRCEYSPAGWGCEIQVFPQGS